MPKAYSGNTGRRPLSLSQLHLDRFAGGSNSALRTFLQGLARRDVVYWDDDFLGTAIHANYYTTGESGAATPFAVTASIGGFIQGVTGTASGNAETIRGPGVHFTGNRNCWVEARIRLDAVTSVMLEFGLIDAATDYTIPVVSSVDTPAFAAGVGDAAVLAMDTSGTLTTMGFFTLGSGGTGYSVKGTTLSPAFTPTAGAFHTYRVGLEGTVPYFFVDGLPYRTSEQLISATAGNVAATTRLIPWIAVRTRTTAARTVGVDYLLAMQDRTARVAN